jgi:hypothetical protein
MFWTHSLGKAIFPGSQLPGGLLAFYDGRGGVRTRP